MPVQVFVANPNKTEKITELLQHNKDKLLRYLGDFHTDKGASSFLHKAPIFITGALSAPGHNCPWPVLP